MDYGETMELQTIQNALRNHRMEPVTGVPRRSAVLIPLIQRDGELSLLFETRNAAIRQGGEICFPGGRLENGETPEQAAVRETCEELLVAPSQIRVIAPMFRTERGNLQILSYLGTITEYEGTFSPDEVANTFQIPLAWFLAHEPEMHTGKLTVQPDDGFPYELIPGGRDYPFAAGTRQFYFYRTPYGVVWGLTASILYHSVELLKSEIGEEHL